MSWPLNILRRTTKNAPLFIFGNVCKKHTTPPRKPKNQEVRSREHLTPAEAELLMQAAKQEDRHGHRDATLILLMYRHGLRVSETIA
jgi:site-specific recombinase XerD